jgi:Domain of unknown function (DUF3536)/Glycosyl hydrolase family 57
LSFALVIHGHFYQPPRENPWTDEVEREPSAAPFHDWNARIHAECYRANAFARIHDRAGRIQSIVNNYSRLSFNFGPTLARWIQRNDPGTHLRLIAGDEEQQRRLGGGGAMAQAYAHPIVPLSSPRDSRTQILWGLADFRRRFGRSAEGFWLPETAANAATLQTLIDLGVSYTILAPEQVAAVRASEGGGAGPKEDWVSVDRDAVDTGRAYRWMHPDGSGRFLTVAVFDGPMSRGVAFGDATRDSATFIAAARASAARSRVSDLPLVLCASDGELFGHHKKFADLNLAFTTAVEGPRQGIVPTNISAYLRAHPATWEMALAEGPDGKGTSWSCAHGVGRWARDCGCSMTSAEHGWNQRWRTPLRAALDRLQQSAAAFFEDQGAELFADPWAARDAYGEVMDDSIDERDARMATLGTAALAAGGDRTRHRARLLLEMQRATVLMYSSCGWYFDDIAGLEAGLILRLAAYAGDLMKEAGGEAPLADMLDILADAKSNQAGAGTGADVFRQVATDRITPSRAAATVAIGLVAAPGPTSVVKSPGYAVDVLAQSVQRRHESAELQLLDLSGRARVTSERTGATSIVEFAARWDSRAGAGVFVDGVEIAVRDLGRESRNRLLPLLVPRLLEEAAPLPAARLALDLGKDVVGSADTPEDLAVRRGYARMLLRLLMTQDHLPAASLEVAMQLFDAAGSAMAPGSSDRGTVEERVAELIDLGPGWADLRRLANKLGFATGELATIALSSDEQ